MNDSTSNGMKDRSLHWLYAILHLSVPNYIRGYTYLDESFCKIVFSDVLEAPNQTVSKINNCL